MYVDCSINCSRAHAILRRERRLRQLKNRTRKSIRSHRQIPKENFVFRPSAMGEVDVKKQLYPGMTVLGLTGSIGK
jgi:hypothetical protein